MLVIPWPPKRVLNHYQETGQIQIDDRFTFVGTEGPRAAAKSAKRTRDKLGGYDLYTVGDDTVVIHQPTTHGGTRWAFQWGSLDNLYLRHMILYKPQSFPVEFPEICLPES